MPDFGNNPHSVFELVEEADDVPVPDTLSEVFQFEARPDDAPTISPDSVRTLFVDQSARANLWLAFGLTAIGIIALFLVGLMAKMR